MGLGVRFYCWTDGCNKERFGYGRSCPAHKTEEELSVDRETFRNVLMKIVFASESWPYNGTR